MDRVRGELPWAWRLGALVTLDAVAALPEELVPEGAAAAARVYLEELRADAVIARLDTIARPPVHETT